MTARFKDLALDANDHQVLADWWCRALGYVRRDSLTGDTRPDAWPVPIVDPAGDGEVDWDVPADPEGTEFCVFAPR
ncbi:hypothetical protein PV458_09390 [Streptomyces sp. MN03-5084-2B]|nr:hypothetical protein [Streptomyces sp. MN03-5084-2B]